MRGHLPMIAMRRRGLRPSMVMLDDVPGRSSGLWRTWPVEQPSIATVEIQPSDSLALLDLRFVVGLRVVVKSIDERRLGALRKAAMDGGAVRVVAALLTPGWSRGEPDFEVSSLTETFAGDGHA